MPALNSLGIIKRQDSSSINNGCPSGYTESGGYCYDPWYLYGRWVLLGAVIIGAFVLFCCFSCITARRRRRLGRAPMRGTGWAAPPPYSGGPGYHGGQAYPQQENQWQQPPPQYGAPDGTHYGKTTNQPYGGQQENGIELQAPGQTYQGGSGYGGAGYNRGGDHVHQAPDNGYAPPSGPPPAKGDGIIR